MNANILNWLMMNNSLIYIDNWWKDLYIRSLYILDLKISKTEKYLTLPTFDTRGIVHIILTYSSEQVRRIFFDPWDDRRRPPPYNVGNCCRRRNIKRECTQSIVSDDLGYRKVSARWVPRLSTENQKANRLAVCERLGTISNRGKVLSRHIVTCDKTWVHHYIPESEQPNMKRRNLG